MRLESWSKEAESPCCHWCSSRVTSPVAPSAILRPLCQSGHFREKVHSASIFLLRNAFVKVERVFCGRNQAHMFVSLIVWRSGLPAHFPSGRRRKSSVSAPIARTGHNDSFCERTKTNDHIAVAIYSFTSRTICDASPVFNIRAGRHDRRPFKNGSSARTLARSRNPAERVKQRAAGRGKCSREDRPRFHRAF